MGDTGGNLAHQPAALFRGTSAVLFRWFTVAIGGAISLDDPVLFAHDKGEE